VRAAVLFHDLGRLENFLGRWHREISFGICIDVALVESSIAVADGIVNGAIDGLRFDLDAVFFKRVAEVEFVIFFFVDYGAILEFQQLAALGVGFFGYLGNFLGVFGFFRAVP
jgi:hypothetical protein